MQDEQPTFIGDWRLLERLGAVGPAVRVRAKGPGDLEAHLLVRTKEGAPEGSSEAWRKLAADPLPSQPGILAPSGFVEDEHHIALVLPPADAQPLDRWFVDVQPSHATCMEIICVVLEAVAFLHRAGRPHGAIAPDTILIDRRGNPLILGPGGLASANPVHDVPAGLDLLYRAPGVILGKEPADASSDVYGLGCLLHFFSFGAHPWGARQLLSELLKKKRTTTFDPPLATSRAPTSELLAIITRCSQAFRRDRARTATEVIDLMKEAELWADGMTDTESVFGEYIVAHKARTTSPPVEKLRPLSSTHLDVVGGVGGALTDAAVMLLTAAPGLAINEHWPDPLRQSVEVALTDKLGNLDRVAVVTRPDLGRVAAARLPALARSLRRLDGAATLKSLLDHVERKHRLALLACLVFLQAEDALTLEPVAGDWPEAW